VTSTIRAASVPSVASVWARKALPVTASVSRYVAVFQCNWWLTGALNCGDGVVPWSAMHDAHEGGSDAWYIVLRIRSAYLRSRSLRSS
jgi:hypothetical protein